MCVGAYVLDQTSQKIFSILAKETILASGGLGSVFLQTNPPGARGDGIAVAYPPAHAVSTCNTCSSIPPRCWRPMAAFLILETVRGEGGRLVDRHGEELIQKFHPAGCAWPRVM